MKDFLFISLLIMVIFFLSSLIVDMIRIRKEIFSNRKSKNNGQATQKI
jgi:hypothetical protein